MIIALVVSVVCLTLAAYCQTHIWTDRVFDGRLVPILLAIALGTIAIAATPGG